MQNLLIMAELHQSGARPHAVSQLMTHQIYSQDEEIQFDFARADNKSKIVPINLRSTRLVAHYRKEYARLIGLDVTGGSDSRLVFAP